MTRPRVPGGARAATHPEAVQRWRRHIEQDADTVLMLHRPGRYDGGQEDNVIEVIVAKQRNGPTGDLTLAWLSKFMRFENYAGSDRF